MRNEEAAARTQRYMDSLIEDNERKVSIDRYEDPDGHYDAASYAADRWPNYVD